MQSRLHNYPIPLLLSVIALSLALWALFPAQTAYANCGTYDPTANGATYFWNMSSTANSGANSPNAALTVQGGASQAGPSLLGDAGNSSEFDGTDAQQINIAAHTGGTSPNNNLNGIIELRAYELWFSPDIVTGEQSLMETGGGTNGFVIWLNGNVLTVSAYEDTGGSAVTTTYAGIEVGKIYHMVVNIDVASATMELYVNSTLVDTQVMGGTLTDNTRINAGTDGGAFGGVSNQTRRPTDATTPTAGTLGFDGRIDDVAVYIGKTLTQTDVDNGFACHPTAVTLSSNTAAAATSTLWVMALLFALMSLVSFVVIRRRKILDN